MNNFPIVGFAAYSGSGKTTLLSGVIPILRSRGLHVGIIKHAHHNFSIDIPGKDSYELRSAGADQVLIASKQRVAWMQEKPQETSPALGELLNYFKGQELDIVIVEGFKHEPFSKIEVHRTAVKRPLLAEKDANIIAVATDAPQKLKVDVKTLDLNDYQQIAEFILLCKQQNKLTLAFRESQADDSDSR